MPDHKIVFSKADGSIFDALASGSSEKEGRLVDIEFAREFPGLEESKDPKKMLTEREKERMRKR